MGSSMSGVANVLSAWVKPLRAILLACTATGMAFGGGPAATGNLPVNEPFSLPTKAEAQLIVEKARNAEAPGASAFYLEFLLRELPRRGDGRTVRGRIWIGAGKPGPAARISVVDHGVEYRFLVQGGAHPQAWRWTAGSPAQTSDLLVPLDREANITAFDLEMPFLYWPDPRVLSLNHILGRETNGFVFRPPPDFAAAHPEIYSVRAYLDRVYNAPLKIQIIGNQGSVRKTSSLLSLKQVGDRWIPGAFEVRDEVTHNDTRFIVTAACLRRDPSPAIFEADQLGAPVEVPAGVVRWGDSAASD